MKRLLMVTFLLLVTAPAAFAQPTFTYAWTISSSNSDPLVNTGPVVGGAPFSLFLWFYCSPDGGMSAAEFDLTIPATVLNFGFTPASGGGFSFLNAGGSSTLLLAVGGCPTGPIVAGSWGFFGGVAGDYCLIPSAATGTRGTVDCTGTPQLWPISFKGFTSGGGVSTCDETLDCTSPVQATSWGAVKALYR